LIKIATRADLKMAVRVLTVRMLVGTALSVAILAALIFSAAD
jgi:hypothetical protein